jgi:hypothetical protein
MTVPTMRAENDVLGFQMGANADGDRLLADIGVTGAVNQAALVRPGQLLFATADQQHLPVERQELRLVQSDKLSGLHGGQFTMPAWVRHLSQSVAIVDPNFLSCYDTRMTIQELRKMLHAQPFRPFDIHLADGRSISVNHPEFVGEAPSGRTIGVGTVDGFEIVDLLLVTSLKPRPNEARRRRPGP